MPNIFLSYAREDENLAADVTNRIQYNPGFSVWIDKNYLIGGDAWEKEIRKNIELSDFFVPLISTNFLSRSRFAHKELKWALELSTSGVKGVNFVVPVRLEQIDIMLDELKKMHVIDLFDNKTQSLYKLFAALTVFGAVAARDINAKIRLTSHQARFRRSPKMYYFINVCSIAAVPVSLTHVHYMDIENSIHIQPSSRPLPVRLDIGEPWCTYVAVDKLPEKARQDAYDKFVVRLATGEIYRSTKENSVLPEGSVPGGAIHLDKNGEDPTA